MLNTCVGVRESLGTSSFGLEPWNRVLTYHGSSISNYVPSVEFARKAYWHLFEVEAPYRFVSQLLHFGLAHTLAEQKPI